ncbi:MAG TPA: hypothetical protein PLC52_09770 [Anaerolineales bacterium]|nr:hypothetical protein [Anaerolineales bacterium]HRQ93138.1 hypothetical protein [Anaerolineales bacterium]
MKKLAIFLIAACFIAACSPAPQQQAPQPTPTSQPTALPDTPAAQVQQVNGIRIEASDFRLENGRIALDVCYEIPDARSWVISNVEITAGLQNSQAVEMVLIELRLPAVDGQQNVITLDEERMEADQNDGGGVRCDLVRPLEILPTDQAVTVHIGALMAEPYESEMCDPAYLARVNTLLAMHHAELVADCLLQEHEGGVSSGLKIVAWPSSMNEHEAQAVMDSDFFLDLNGIRGPWVFEFQIDE